MSCSQPCLLPLPPLWPKPHGANEPWSIGKAASPGCIRMLNEDVFELCGSAQTGMRVIVR